MSLAALKRQIAEIVAPTVIQGETIATGIAALDSILEGGGVPCGRLTDLSGAPGSGTTTLTRSIVQSALIDKRWVAYIDAGRTLAPADWVELSATGRLWIVRPPDSDRGPWCADVLLRSGAFGLVVLDGGPHVRRSVFIRLNGLARESQAAFLVVRHDEDVAGLMGSALQLRLQRRLNSAASRPAVVAGTGMGGRAERERWRSVSKRMVVPVHGLQRKAAVEPEASASGLATSTRFTIECVVRRGGGSEQRTIDMDCAIDVARRLPEDSGIPDRRGAARRNRQGRFVIPSATGAAIIEGNGSTLARKRRCAEPDVRHNTFILDEREAPGRVLPSINYALGTDKRERQIRAAVGSVSGTQRQD